MCDAWVIHDRSAQAVRPVPIPMERPEAPFGPSRAREKK